MKSSILYPIVWVAIMSLGILAQAFSNWEKSNVEIEESEHNNISLIE